ncbi:LacI family transcriptional regulator [Serratia marcescens]|uniref:LacI family DNA-binding transcriptional regulator n=1 Tax=Serratia TaxID=613 RepID=UPI000BB6E7AB|nr:MULTISPECIES: LacI family DNA-binding transcriptional regulator [Serratia]EMB2348817.1 LacI family DNA-binding transcriptional regulator [Serratia marcescens]MBH3082495.1 LacI family DNA-binding transcriptional regulator [Serratia sp. JKS000199]BCZ59684.1 LacI family transcriptional regulator [Serratia marcescens]SNY85798.1 transcriptional regulator, LacI family [Serratia sp. JKS000199]
MDNHSARRVTRADVARVAGTSVAVVSYVINNGPRPVAEATRLRVLAAIEQTGYRPNDIARALASGSTQTYGLVVPDISNPFFATLARALQQEAFSRGRVLLLGDAGDDRQREYELINNLLRRQVDGLLYTSVDRHPWFELIRASGTPCVMIDTIDSQASVCAIRVDERDAACQATRHLLQHGYRDIGIFIGPLTMLNAQDRLNGWRDALLEAGIAPRDEWIFEAPYTRQGGYQATQRMVQGPRPRAVFTSNEQQALGCLSALAEHGLRAPDDLALICFNGTQQSEFSVPPLSAVEQPIDAMAKRAIAMLAAGAAPAELHEFAFQLRIRRSCGC